MKKAVIIIILFCLIVIPKNAGGKVYINNTMTNINLLGKKVSYNDAAPALRLPNDVRKYGSVSLDMLCKAAGADVVFDGRDALITTGDFAKLQIYRENCGDKEQYDRILLSCLKKDKGTALLKPAPVETASHLFFYVYYDNPELIYLSPFLDMRCSSEDKLVHKMEYRYMDVDEAAFLLVAAEINGSASSLDQSEKMVYIKNVMGNAAHDMKAAFNQSAYSAVVTKKTVCSGFSHGFQYFMRRFSIPCKYISGKFDNNDHSWNSVYVSGKEYFIDVTQCRVAGDKYFMMPELNRHYKTEDLIVVCDNDPIL